MAIMSGMTEFRQVSQVLGLWRSLIPSCKTFSSSSTLYLSAMTIQYGEVCHKPYLQVLLLPYRCSTRQIKVFHMTYVLRVDDGTELRSALAESFISALRSDMADARMKAGTHAQIWGSHLTTRCGRATDRIKISWKRKSRPKKMRNE